MKKITLSRYALYAFYVISIINLIEQVIDTGWADLATKPFLMVTLFTFYFTTRKDTSRPSKLIGAALIFSWIGDMLLMLQGRSENVFIFGLVAFLIAHIFYMFGYRKARFTVPGKINNTFVRTRVIFLVLVGGTIVYILYPNLGEMLIPVTFYTIVIITMAISALLRRGWTTDKSFIMVYSGALLFIMSDAMIGINKFISPLVQARLLIMATYIAAQFLIIRGILAHENAQAETQ